LTALIGEAISNGFINGAYEGGVYTTKPTQFTQSASPVSSANTAGNTITTWVNEVVNTISGGKPNESSNQAVHLANDETIKEDCLNTVEVTFPDYMINLIQDSRPIITKTSGVSAVWNFSDAKVNDVFEQQEVGAIFLNSGLKQNTYGVVEFPAIKHTHAKPTEIKTTFGPFNIPDAQVDEVSFKYHFRFNATPRTSTNYYPIEKNICTSGIKRGATGSSALPRTVLSWDWNSITESSTSNLFIEKMQPVGTTNQNDLNLGYNYYNTQIGKGGENEPFIDATQLSILLSKKMASLENILSANNLSCPVNPAKEVLLRVKPEIDTTDSQLPIFGGTSAQSYCYLPLTTRSFDGKPALYYYFENTQNLAGPNDSDYLQTLQRFNELIDFNANLILDGYGLDMQYDFAGSYGTKLFAASPSFMNASTGIKRYFEDKDRLYFSSLANWREPILRWALPDAGKYRIRMIIDFLDNPLLFQSTIPSAKIINDLYLVEPINSNYGPMYYVPFDGPTGLNANNNRRSYGTTLSGVSGLINVVKQEGAYITPTQKDALVKLDALKITNPVLLNYSPSIRSKLLELGFFSNSAYPRGYGTYFNYSPTTATPLLFELNGFTGANTNYLYSLSRDNIGYVPKSPSLFLLSSVGNCTDLAGNKLNKYMNQTPDLQIGTKFGVIFDKAKASGKTYLKTIAYAPAEDIYGIEQGAGGKIYSPNTLFTESKTVWLNGVNGMEYNDTSIGTTINSIQSLFDAVRKGEVCVSRSGVSETYWWPEQQLYNANGENGHTLQQKINDAATGCS
ncbi:MAG: hypothetical protein NTY48_04850, partial [Candidatus Diapherotrites archaeon]|nr:hypothetical protein [Candidatus Diapherotrites archaeon]